MLAAAEAAADSTARYPKDRRLCCIYIVGNLTEIHVYHLICTGYLSLHVLKLSHFQELTGLFIMDEGKLPAVSIP